ncbi:hypothetical protein MARGE09_P3052 [Marinagarivorans cellulosilyticus]|uniref:Pyocin activator protein PrtN n=2 Tax=Marinagarivorans cellulosilyticus TaxID=2721545 RepID=A0AAN2BLC1_9GAMM|nr:hypothetical protein MARGE09_P3052 [Marinagarivorans cellulosilyticus]
MMPAEADLEREIYTSLFEAYGPVVTGKALWSALGYISDDAFRMSISRGEMPIPLFGIEKRRGRYALVKEVARFLAQQRTQNLESPKREEVNYVTVER